MGTGKTESRAGKTSGSLNAREETRNPGRSVWNAPGH